MMTASKDIGQSMLLGHEEMKSPLLQLRHIEKVYEAQGAAAVRALGPIDLDIRTGEFLSVVGPSGCGKSTLMDIMCGLTKQTAGILQFSSTGPNIKDGGIGVVFQEDASFPWLTVAKNIAFSLNRRELGDAEVNARIEHVLNLLGLWDFRHHYPSQLSGGMRQRVSIGRTLATQPKLILMDEPFAALDQQTRLLMGDELLDIWRKTEATVVLITHSLDEAVMLSDRVAVMSSRPGKIIKIVETHWGAGRNSEVLTSAKFGALTGQIWEILRGESLAAMGRSA